MNRLMEEPKAIEADKDPALQEVCGESLAEPARLWDLLEANGIQATPGVVYQVIAHLNRARKTAESEPGETVPADRARGLTSEDLAVVASLAQKAGGIDELVRLLGALGELVKP